MNTPAFAAACLLGLPALRRLAVRDALADAFATGLGRPFLAATLVAPLLGVTLFLFVLPLIPWLCRKPLELVSMFLFAVQHLGDLVAGVLVVGQAGLADHEGTRPGPRAPPLRRRGRRRHRPLRAFCPAARLGDHRALPLHPDVFHTEWTEDLDFNHG